MPAAQVDANAFAPAAPAPRAPQLQQPPPPPVQQEVMSGPVEEDAMDLDAPGAARDEEPDHIIYFFLRASHRDARVSWSFTPIQANVLPSFFSHLRANFEHPATIHRLWSADDHFDIHFALRPEADGPTRIYDVAREAALFIDAADDNEAFLDPESPLAFSEAMHRDPVPLVAHNAYTYLNLMFETVFTLSQYGVNNYVSPPNVKTVDAYWCNVRNDVLHLPFLLSRLPEAMMPCWLTLEPEMPNFVDHRFNIPPRATRSNHYIARYRSRPVWPFGWTRDRNYVTGGDFLTQIVSYVYSALHASLINFYTRSNTRFRFAPQRVAISIYLRDPAAERVVKMRELIFRSDRFTFHEIATAQYHDDSLYDWYERYSDTLIRQINIKQALIRSIPRGTLEPGDDPWEYLGRLLIMREVAFNRLVAVSLLHKGSDFNESEVREPWEFHSCDITLSNPSAQRARLLIPIQPHQAVELTSAYMLFRERFNVQSRYGPNSLVPWFSQVPQDEEIIFTLGQERPVVDAGEEGEREQYDSPSFSSHVELYH